MSFEQLTVYDVLGTSPPLARRTDLATSKAAAARAEGVTLERAILAAFRWADLTDDELAERIPDRYSASVKTARSRLFKAGYLRPAGGKRLSARGRDQTVWTLTSMED